MQALGGDPPEMPLLAGRCISQGQAVVVVVVSSKAIAYLTGAGLGVKLDAYGQRHRKHRPSTVLLRLG